MNRPIHIDHTLTPFAEIAKELGMTEEAAKQTCYRALRKIERDPRSYYILRALAAAAELARERKF